MLDKLEKIKALVDTDPQKAIEEILKIDEEDRGYEIISEWGRVENNLGNYERALELFMSIKGEGEKDEKWNYRVGYAYSGLEKYEEANKFLIKALEINSNYPWPYFELGWNLKKLGREDEALDYLEKMLKFEPNDVNTFLTMGDIYFERSQFDKSLECYLKVEELGEKDFVLNLNIGFCMNEVGRSEEALKYYLKALEEASDNSLLISQIGVTYGALGDLEEGIKFLKRAYEMGRDDVWLNSDKYMKKASEKGELNGWVDLELAWNFAEIGEKEAAKGYLANVEKYLNINDEGVSRDYKIVKAQIESLPTLLA